jgi:succinate dehydrogenase/fumarate reductase flavoprotein subunit
MNQPSIDLYRQMGVDLSREPLAIGVCAQHCNGGFAVDDWLESNIKRLFIIGELAGTHGVKRPGGSALNAGQVGGLRAAQRIANVYNSPGMKHDTYSVLALPVVRRVVSEIEKIKSGSGGRRHLREKEKIQKRMSEYAGMVRSRQGLERALVEAEEQWEAMKGKCLKGGKKYLAAFEVRELALAGRAFLEATLTAIKKGSGSRGSHLVLNSKGKLPHPDLGREWRYLSENKKMREAILGIEYDIKNDSFRCRSRKPRRGKTTEAWFENTWAEYRRGDVFRKRGD